MYVKELVLTITVYFIMKYGQTGDMYHTIELEIWSHMRRRKKDLYELLYDKVNIYKKHLFLMFMSELKCKKNNGLPGAIPFSRW